ncbi:MAG: hypothetical protein B9S38_02410 [Verrucomicrobiia bacterium Tous-C4TDCM]|nr:MAG: hypothetical protein B9S38_02410 [Verrucomicrobiae bacterium Tous-C4TDCM]
MTRQRTHRPNTPPTLPELVARAERAHAEQVLQEVCAAVGIGLRTLQSQEQSRDGARRRAVVAWVLHREMGWTETRTAEALNRSVRQVRRMLRHRRDRRHGLR